MAKRWFFAIEMRCAIQLNTLLHVIRYVQGLDKEDWPDEPRA